MNIYDPELMDNWERIAAGIPALQEQGMSRDGAFWNHITDFLTKNGYQIDQDGFITKPQPLNGTPMPGGTQQPEMNASPMPGGTQQPQAQQMAAPVNFTPEAQQAVTLAQQYGNASTMDPRYPDWMLTNRNSLAGRNGAPQMKKPMPTLGGL